MDSKSAGRQGYDYGNPGTTLTDAMRLWPTPDASVSNDSEEPEQWRARQTELRKKGVNGNGAGVPLAIATKEWATPTASESANRTTTEPASVTDGRGHGAHLSAQTMAWMDEHRSLPDLTTEPDGESTSSAGRVLNPRFVEALMGFPLGWTDFELLETPSSRSRRESLSRFLLSAAERRR